MTTTKGTDAMKTMTHEAFILAVRDRALARLPEGADRTRLAHTKLVYGTGAGRAGVRGTTFHGTWQNGHPDALATLEICSFAEEGPCQLAGTTLHEMGHALAGPMEGHGKAWRAACARLGLTVTSAAGQTYTWDAFAPDIRKTLERLPEPTDGKPVALVARRGGAQGPRPCTMGQGSRGGTSRGPGSGSRYRLWVCGCGVKVRVASEDFQAICGRCAGAFARA
jgi:hypothetical protein